MGAVITGGGGRGGEMCDADADGAATAIAARFSGAGRARAGAAGARAHVEFKPIAAPSAAARQRAMEAFMFRPYRTRAIP